MSDSKLWGLCILLGIGLAFVAFAVWNGLPGLRDAVENTPARPSVHFIAPKTVTHTYNFMPGQYADVPNRAFRKIEVRSEFPVRVVTGTCQQNYTVDFYCDGAPSDVFITDMRRQPIFATPQANPITISATEY